LSINQQQSEVVTKDNVQPFPNRYANQNYAHESRSENGIDNSKIVSEYESNTNY
jgi:hypothetical protein